MTYMTSGSYYEYDEPQMRKETIELLWHEFGNCCRDENDCIDSSWCGWECGTNVHEIWHWFDAQYAEHGGVHALMFPSEHRREFIEGKLEETAIETNNDVSFLQYFSKNGEAVIVVFEDDSKKVVDIKGKSLDEVTAEIMKAIG